MRCDLKIVDRLDVGDVVENYLRLYAQGKHGAPPDPMMYQWMFERGPHWVLAVVPLEYLDFQDEEQSSEMRIARARRYAERDTVFPPEALRPPKSERSLVDSAREPQMESSTFHSRGA